MRYVDIIQDSLDYIEDHLKIDITAEELCDRAGFSLFHYYRLFQSAVGMPVMKYIQRRRLLWAAYEMAHGEKRIDTALVYGFDTDTGFYKAFRREFGCSPSEYVKRFHTRKPYRIHLLQEEHSMLTQSRIHNVLQNWMLADYTIKSIVDSSTGGVNENVFYIGDDYVLKAFTTPARAKITTDITTALYEAGLSSATIVKTKDTQTYLSDGDLYFVLTTRIDGDEMKSADIYTDANLATYLGEIIGQLHIVLQQCDDIVCNERNIFEEVRDEWLFPVTEQLGLSKAFCDDYINTFGALHDKLPTQIIHRDPNPSNILMQTCKVSGFVDFDLSQRSIRIFDPCYAATALLVEAFERRSEEWIARWPRVFQSIINGYDTVAHLTAEEKQALPYVVLSIQLICVGWFSAQEKYKDLAELNAAALRWLLEHFYTLIF